MKAICVLMLLVGLLAFAKVQISGGIKVNNGGYGEVKIDEIVDVYDGDTIYVNVKGWPEIIGKRIGVRLWGIDCPEIKSKVREEKDLAIKAQEFAERELRGAKIVILKNMKRDKYFRILADVYYDGKNLAEMMLKNNYAKRYYGEKKDVWYKEKRKGWNRFKQ